MNCPLNLLLKYIMKAGGTCFGASHRGLVDPTEALRAYPYNFVTDKQTHTHSVY